MHSGHKLLLTQASLLTDKRMLIGVTGDQLLKKKSYADMLETFEKRCENVRNFLTALRGVSFEIDIFELNDPAGKAATDPEIQACILTKEVEKGGAIINEARTQNGLGQLDLVFVDMILAKDGEEEK